MKKIQITTSGIKKTLKKYNYLQSITEYIWNGFDATATEVEIIIERNTLGSITKFQIRDNGYGIPHNKLKRKFVPFFDSEKEFNPHIKRLTSAVHGKNGIGRLTFFSFASKAVWETVYKRNDKNHKYEITINSASLGNYNDSKPVVTDIELGTTVSFFNIKEIRSDDEIIDFLKKEFCWFLELNKEKKYAIKINGEHLDYTSIVGDSDSITLTHKGTNTVFHVNYVRWDVNINKEYSRYYCINSKDIEVLKKTTTLNNKGDSFYHSVYVKSSFFDNFIYRKHETDQIEMFSKSRRDDEFKFMIEEINRFTRSKRKPFLKKYTDTLIADFESNQVFPAYNTNNLWEKTRKNELESVVRELYQVEPSIFTNLNVKQKITFVRLLDLIMDAGERGKLFDILEQVTELDSEDRKELSNILKTTKLSRIIETLKLISDRFKAINDLKRLVNEKQLNANEPKHIQKFIEKHYWIFGEQYNLLAAAERKFETALRRFVHLLRGEDEKIKIDHPDKYKEMDIFMVRQRPHDDIVENIVVELKNPKIKLGKKEYHQVDMYLDVILSQDEFNASNMQWTFFLVGNKFDKSGFIEKLFENAKNHGERSLAFKTNRYKIYIKKWSEIFTEFELNHRYLQEKLELERDLLASEAESADVIIQEQEKNTATQPPELTEPV